MPRRASARFAVPPPNDAQSSQASAPTEPTSLPEDLVTLRTHWKWAAFSQFFFTFSQLLNVDDVTLNNVEDDLVHGLNLYLPRIIVRLLFTLTYDRKINLNNWQSALRKQYNKRDPDKNPIGTEPPKDNASSRYASVLEEPVTPEPQIDEADTTADELDHSSPTQDEGDDDENIKVEDDTPQPSSKAQKEFVDIPEGDTEQQGNTKDWLTLPILEKLDSLHLLTEWQFQNPTRLRQLMRSDDEQATWRIEPIGYDAKKNAYWLIGADRLWIQRTLPRPPRPAPKKNNLKRKRGVTDSKQAKSVRTSAPSNKRLRLQSSSKNSTVPDSPASGRRGRAAKAQANLKLDAQAKQLAELNRQAAALARVGSSSTKSGRRQQTVPTTPPKTSRAGRGATRSRPLGTRVSARLRGADDEDDEEWQEIPEEWLNENESDEEYKGKGKGKSRRTRASAKTGLESDKSSVSDLTELSELSGEEGEEEEEEEDSKIESPEPETETEPEISQEAKNETLENFIEWETVCANLYEWEHIAERWQNATHYAEKALYKLLTKEIVPVVTEELREIENKRKMEEAIVHRKRSSRLAIKEIEKEEAKVVARKKAEEDEKLGRQRRAEARAQREEAERKKREMAREQRRKERDAREEAEAAAQKEAEEKEKRKQEASERGKVEEIPRSAPGKRGRKKASDSVDGLSNGHPHPAVSRANDWEVDCEICQRGGTNIDGDKPMMCCGLCLRWQHIACHDRADQLAGRPRRDWKKVDFYCLRCRQRAVMNGAHRPESVVLHPPNSHPSLKIPSTSTNGIGINSSYNHTPYGLASSSYSESHLNNGYTDYGARKGYTAVSDIRSSASHSQLPATGYATASSAMPPPKQISFSHYQPQQHDFSSYTSSKAPPQQQASYGPSSPQVQAYGQQQPQSTHTQFIQHYPSTSIDSQNYSRSAPSSGWNGTATQTMGYPALTSYAASAERSSASAQPSVQDLPHRQQLYPSQQWHPYTQGSNMTYSPSYQRSS